MSLVASHLLWYQFHRILSLLNKVVLSIWCLAHNDISKSFVFSGNKNNTLSTRCCTSKSFLYMHTYTITHHMHVHVSACMLSRSSPVQLFVTLWTVAHQAPLSTEFSRQEYWKALPCPPPGDLLNTGIKSGLLCLLHRRWIFYRWALCTYIYIQKYIVFMLTNWSLQLRFSRYKPKDDQGFNWFIRDYTASKWFCYQPGFLASLINRNWSEARQEVQTRFCWGPCYSRGKGDKQEFPLLGRSLRGVASLFLIWEWGQGYVQGWARRVA